MQWNAIVAAVRGEVDGSDVAALIAASRPLYTLTQQLADRRLDIELAHPGDAERIVDYIGPLAAPLWIADNAVGVAQSLCDAEAQEHPQTPTRMPRDTHDHALALLSIVEPIMGEVSTALANPSYAMNLRMPMTLGLQGGVVGMLGFVPLDPAYLRGVAQGAERLQGAAQQAVQECTKLAQSQGAPSWLRDVLQYFGGQMASAEVRLESIRARSAPLLAHQKLSDQALQQIIVDCWAVIDIYANVGQLATYPRLAPGVPRRDWELEHAAAPAPAPAPQTPRVPEPSPPPTPPAGPVQRDEYMASGAALDSVPLPEPPRRLPDIAPQGALSSPTPVRPVPGKPEAPRRLPEIGSSALAGATSSQQNARSDVIPHALPRIGPTTPLPTEAGALPEARALPEIGPTRPAAVPGDSIQGADPARPVARRVTPENRWVFCSPQAHQRLRDAGREDEAQRDLDAFWQGRGWVLYRDEEAYLLAVNALLQQGAVERSGDAMEGPPFAAIYRVLADGVTVGGAAIPVDTRFSYNHKSGHVIIV